VVKERTSILIIEDDATLAEAMLSLFQRHHFFAVVAKTPAQALSEIQQQKFNFMFLDCMLQVKTVLISPPNTKL